MRPDPNYRPDRNPFSLAKPPSWWLRGLYRFDPDLVLIPSRSKPVHILARRRRLSGPVAAAVDRRLGVVDPAHAFDSVMCDDYGCVVVTTIFAAGAWTTANLQVTLDELSRRDTWKHGGRLDAAQQRAALFEGGSALAKQIDAQDEADRAAINRQVRDDLYHASGDAWRSRQARTGARSKLTAGQPAQRGLIATPTPMPAARPVTGV